MKLSLRVKAAVTAVSSIFGTTLNQLTRPVGSGLRGWVSEPFAGGWQQGVQVEQLGNLTAFSAVYACATRIASDIAKLELQLTETQQDGTTIPASDKSPHWIPLRRPNNFQNRVQFIRYWILCKLLHGNAYALKVRDERNMVAKLYLLDPRRVHPLVTPEGDVYYSLGGDDLAKIPVGMVVPASEIIHDRCCTLWHPLVGISPMFACAISATQGLRIQANSAAFFANMSRPSGMLTAPGTIDPTTAERLKTQFQQNYGGPNIGKLAVLGDGLKYEPMVIAAEAAQLIEQLKWTVEDVARAFSMPLYKIGAGQMPTNNNVESLNQQYYGDCLQVHVVDLETCLTQGLEVPSGYAVNVDEDGLLRMDKGALIEMLAKGVGAAIIKPNESRQRLNLPSATGGDSLYLQEQNYSLEALAKRDAKEDPFATTPAPKPTTTEEDDAADQAAKFIETLRKGLEDINA